MFKIMFYAGLALSIVFLVISIILFVRNNVAKLIGDVTGWNTKKAMKELHKKSAPRKAENILTDSEGISVRDEGTTLLMEEESTTLLVEEETTLLSEESTALLNGDETTLLVEEDTTLMTRDEAGIFEVEESVTVTHTEERIDTV